jgi:S-adenosylmethionine synthetase
MFEKVNKYHPDKLADRIAGAMVDLAYKKQNSPKVAVEVLLGHGECNIIAESSYKFSKKEVKEILKKIVPEKVSLHLKVVPQDWNLAKNQADVFPKCGDNGIFKGISVNEEEKELIKICKEIEAEFPYDGKYILDKENSKLIICQSHTTKEDDERLKEKYHNLGYKTVIVNPLGPWEGSISVDSGATNRKLGSDMAQSITGGGLHGKDLTKADVSINIYVWLKAQAAEEKCELSCAIGDKIVDSVNYQEIVHLAEMFIKNKGGFEKFAEYGLLD